MLRCSRGELWSRTTNRLWLKHFQKPRSVSIYKMGFAPWAVLRLKIALLSKTCFEKCTFDRIPGFSSPLFEECCGCSFSILSFDSLAADSRENLHEFHGETCQLQIILLNLGKYIADGRRNMFQSCPFVKKDKCQQTIQMGRKVKVIGSNLKERSATKVLLNNQMF